MRAVEHKDGAPPALPKASIVIPTYDGIRQLVPCVRALRATLGDGFDGEVIVVDDGGTPETGRQVLSELERRHSWLRVVRNEEPRLHRVVQPRGGGGDRRRPRLPERRHDPAARLAAPPAHLPHAARRRRGRWAAGLSRRPAPGGGRRHLPRRLGRELRARRLRARRAALHARARRPLLLGRAARDAARPVSLARRLRHALSPRVLRGHGLLLRCAGRDGLLPARIGGRAPRGATSRTDANAGAKRRKVKNRQTFRAKWRGTLASLPEAPTRYSGLVCSARVGRSRPMSALPRRARARLRSAAAGVRPRERLEAHLPPGRVPARRRLARGVRLRERAAGVPPSAAPAPARDRDLRRVRRAHAGADRGRRLRPRAVRVLAARREARGARAPAVAGDARRRGQRGPALAAQRAARSGETALQASSTATSRAS